jgi:hypothetical protein
LPDIVRRRRALGATRELFDRLSGLGGGDGTRG